jgi:hypothetical protein
MLTIQYFYTKTRNYRMLFGALRTGGKYAFALSSATLAYVLLDESVGVARERMVGEHGTGQWQHEQSDDGRPRRVGWRKGGVWWGDGLIAGALLGMGVGAICKSQVSILCLARFGLMIDRLPRPLFVRSMGIGMIMGGTTSALQTVQAKVGEMRTATEQSKVTTTPIGEVADIGISIPKLESPVEEMPGVAADMELPQTGIPEQAGSGWNSLWSWIPGTSR